MTAEVSRKGAPRWMKIALILSLIVNFLVIGAAVGAAARLKDLRDAFDPPVHFGRVIKALPEEKRSALRDRFAERRQELGALRRARGDARLALADALSGDPLDPSAFDEALAALRASELSLRGASMDLLGETLRGLEPEDRREIARRLREGRRSHHGRSPGN